MNFPEPAVLLDQQQMDVLERVANNAGITGEELVRETLKRVLDSLEQPWRVIPFQFLGSENNDTSIDDSPLYDMAEVNIGHYRNSADYEEAAYRSGECGYAGGPVANYKNNPTSDPAQDQCSRTMTGCKKRFGEFGALPFGGFPAIARVPRL